MSTEKILQRNKLIAEFMGLYYPDTKYPFGKPNAEVKYAEPQYHTSWDWLKPVIDKIFEYSLAYPDAVKRVSEMKIVVNIDDAWQRVVQFIQWYNTTKTPQP